MNGVMLGEHRGAEMEEDLKIVSQSGTFSSDMSHPRAHCVKYPFKVVKERVGLEGADGNETYCENCFCYVCDSKASECQARPPSLPFPLC